MEVNLKSEERLDELQINDARIIQNPNCFCFGIDAVLIANFAKVHKNDVVADLGAGNGAISIITALKKQPALVHSVEIQETIADMAKRSVILNNLEDKVKVHNIDLKDAPKVIGKDKLDVIITNPPYQIAGTGLKNPDEAKAIARHEICCTLEDVIRVSKEMLKYRGKFFMVHRPDRLVDILYLLRNYDMEPKYLRFVHTNLKQKPSMILIEASKCGGRELKVMEPLYVYNDDGSYTEDIKQIYNSN